MITIILEILIFCVEHHIVEARHYLTRHDLLPRIAVLARTRHVFLAATVVRFFRKLLSRNDGTYAKQIIDQWNLEPILACFEDTAFKYNILQSSILELIEFICSNCMRDVGMHLWEEFSSTLAKHDCVRRVKLDEKLKAEYDKRKDNKIKYRWQPSIYSNSSQNDSSHDVVSASFSEDKDDDDMFDTSNIGPKYNSRAYSSLILKPSS